MLLRTLASAALAALVVAADVVVLALFLNPQVEPRREALALLVALFLPLALGAFLAFALLALAVSVFRFWPRGYRSPLEGLPWFTTLMLLAVAAAGFLFWYNRESYRDAVPLEALAALRTSTLALAVAALVLLAVGLEALLRRRARPFSAALVVLAPAFAVIVPLALRPALGPRVEPVPMATETVQPARRVVVVGVDGLPPVLLPAFSRVLKQGASGPLTTLRPAEGPPVWTTIMTGRLPRDHGVKSFSTYRLWGSETVYELLPKGILVRLLERAGLVSTRPVTSAARLRRALWNVVNAFGIPAGVVRVWGTFPPEHVQGFMLSHYFHLLAQDAGRAAEALYPRDPLAEVEARTVRPEDVDPALLAEFLEPTSDAGGEAARLRRDLVERALAPDLTYRQAGAFLRETYDPPFFVTYFYGLDVVGHTFTRFAEPDRFGDVRPEEVRRYGRTRELYAAFLSQWVDELARGRKPGEILLVVSGYGMEPVPLWRRVLDASTGAPRVSGTHAGGPDGFLIAVGDGIKAGARLRRASVLDLAPTLLYLVGLPVARDMEGRVLTEILEDSFARAHPVTFIPSYESLAITPVGPGSPEDLPPLPEEGP